MHRSIGFLLCLIALVGCGKSADETSSAKPGARRGLSGSQLESGIRNTVWGVEFSSNTAQGFRFSQDGHYYGVVVQKVAGRIFNAMASRGTYSFQDDQVKLYRLSTTCPTLLGKGPVDATYQLVDPDTFAVSKGSLTAVMKKFDPGPPPSMLVRWGCFNPDGSFVEHAWTDL
jgi:hypothetical protein